MSRAIGSLTTRPSWNALAAHHKKIRAVHLRTLFADDPRRGIRMTAEAVGIFLDYSKNRVTDDTVRLLLDLATTVGFACQAGTSFRQQQIT